MGKYYAIIHGRGSTPDIVTSWADCEQRVKGYPNAQFKSFRTREEAERYIRQQGPQEQQAGLQAYVDGSFSRRQQKNSYGVVLVRDGKVVEELSGSSRTGISMRQVYGELLGAMKAAERAQAMGESRLTIHYDYAGIENWARGNWKRNNPHTQRYHDFMQDMQKQLSISFQKVRAHTGDRFNERADDLAKQAL